MRHGQEPCPDISAAAPGGCFPCGFAKDRRRPGTEASALAAAPLQRAAPQIQRFLQGPGGTRSRKTSARPIKNRPYAQKRLTESEQNGNIAPSSELIGFSRRCPQAVHRFSRTCPPLQQKKECAMHAILPTFLFTVSAVFAVFVLGGSARRFGAAFAGLRQAQGAAPVPGQCTVTLRTLDVTWTGGGVRRGQTLRAGSRPRPSMRPLRAAA